MFPPALVLLTPTPSPQAGPHALLGAPLRARDSVSDDLGTCDLRGMQGNSECHFQLHPPSATARWPGDRSGPYFMGQGQQARAAWPLCWQLAAESPAEPPTVVGKSRTTGSRYLTSVSSTIAKNGGRRAGLGLGLGQPGSLC